MTNEKNRLLQKRANFKSVFFFTAGFTSGVNRVWAVSGRPMSSSIIIAQFLLANDLERWCHIGGQFAISG